MDISYNWVLIKPDENFKNYDGTNLATANDAESAGQRLSLRGTIIKLPKRLKYNGAQLIKERNGFANDRASIAIYSELKENSMLFDTTIEPKEGDTVFFSYIEHLECYQHGRFIETEDRDLLLMRYDSLVCSHRLNNIESLKPLNGLVLIEPLSMQEDKTPIETVTLQKYKNKIQKIGTGRVLLTGKKCNGYLEDLTAPKDTDEVKEGQIILFRPAGATLLEWHTHKVLFKGKTVMSIHRKDILMIN